jgi:hypothetical protein
MIANDFSLVEDACTGLVDAALPPIVRQVSDVPSKVQYLFLGCVLRWGQSLSRLV